MAETKQSNTKVSPSHQGGGRGPARGGYQRPQDTKKTIKRLLGYLLERKGLLILIGVCLVVNTVADVTGTYLLRPVINSLAENMTMNEHLRFLIKGAIAVFLVQLVGSICTYSQSALSAVLAQRAANKLRSDLFDALESKPLSYFDAHTHGELMSRFTNDADNVSFAMEQSFINLVSSALIFLGLVVIMIVISPILFIVTVLMLLCSTLVVKALGKRSREYYRKQQATLGAVNGKIQEVIEGLKVVKAFTHEEIVKEEFSELNEAYRAAATDANFYAGAIMPLTSNIINIGYACTAVVGGVLALLRGFDIGGLAAYLIYCRQIGRPVEQISQQITMILSALAGAERIFEVMDAPAEIDNGKVTLVAVDFHRDGNMVETDGHARF